MNISIKFINYSQQNLNYILMRDHKNSYEHFLYKFVDNGSLSQGISKKLIKKYQCKTQLNARKYTTYNIQKGRNNNWIDLILFIKIHYST